MNADSSEMISSTVLEGDLECDKAWAGGLFHDCSMINQRDFSAPQLTSWSSIV